MVYLDVLRQNLKESAKHLSLDGTFIFQQENNPKHTAYNIKMSLLCLFYCPPQSLDINVIENLCPVQNSGPKAQNEKQNSLKTSVARRMGQYIFKYHQKIGRIGTTMFRDHNKRQRACN
ncbi:transposable element Tc1 transposase [Trichonephila clavipes]|nr:transposable element Tc1 transposase [Trichonephila clavipes]